ncbi:MAG: hypothetical protein AAGE92_11330, partial [Cyanobacteria bacterium P01_G01_bin.4]
QEFSVFYSNRLSYEEVATLVERVSGAKLLSDQTIWNLSVAKAQQLSHGPEREVEEAQKSERFQGLSVNPSVDLYARDSREILLFQDGIQVKQQKAERLSQTSDTVGPSKKQPGLITDVALLEKKTGQYEYICAPINKQGNLSITLATVVKARVALEYGHSSGPLNLVAITDGARSIASGLRTAFSSGLVMILDWSQILHQEIWSEKPCLRARGRRRSSSSKSSANATKGRKISRDAYSHRFGRQIMFHFSTQ